MTEHSVIPRRDAGAGEREYQATVASVERSVKARADAKRGLGARLADHLTTWSGSMPFLLANVVWFAGWIAVNLGLVPGVQPFDPFPFGLLTMIVSLEAIVLAIVVLISQNRAAQIADLREEVALQVEQISEQEITKLLRLTVRLMEHQGIDLSGDLELHTMLKATDTEEITQKLEEEIMSDKNNTKPENPTNPTP